MLRAHKTNFFRFMHNSSRQIYCQKSHNAANQRIMAIRREDINVWERRSPLAPSQVKELINKGIRVLVQPSTRRAFTMQEYEEIGAEITEDLSPASFICGVKQVPINELIPEKTYAFFSHTIKAQEANMPLLDALLEKKIRIIDYERLLDEKGQRMVAFGKFAGVGGMVNILHGLGLRFLALGHHTPFMYMGAAHNYKNSRASKLAIYELGEDIAAGKLPKHFGPLSFVFTGSGNVSQGSQEVFQELPHNYVEPHELQEAVTKGDHRKLIATVVSRKDYLVPKAGGKFDAAEYEEYPERYKSIFAEKIAPWATVIINGVYWQPGCPRLLTLDDAQKLLTPVNTPSVSQGIPNLPHKLIGICDISCDLGGSIQFMRECTTIEYPFSMYDYKTKTEKRGVAADGVLMCSIDNVPAQLPREATLYFGQRLMPLIEDLISSDASRPFEEDSLSNTIRNATLTSNGSLTPKYAYISDLRKRKPTITEQFKVDTAYPNYDYQPDKRVLLLGAGYVSHPVVEYLVRDDKVGVTVASVIKKEVDTVTFKFQNTEGVILDVDRDPGQLDKLIKTHDLVISLLPANMHEEVAKKCIQHKKNMVNASYSYSLKHLHQSAQDAGVTLMTEVGLDPGIDHLLAEECFSEVRQGGGEIVSFVSYAGGLPAPENANNPLRYKFSWSPRQVLINTLGAATFVNKGEIVNIPAGGSLMESAHPIDFFPGYNLEGFANRDATVYKDMYSINNAHTIFRGTLRYKGYTDTCIGLQKVGLISEAENSANFKPGQETSWKELMSNLLGKSNLTNAELAALVLKKVGNDEQILRSIKDLGLLEDSPVTTQRTVLDTLSAHLANILNFKKGERDLVLLHHQIGIRWPGNKQNELRNVSMICYGDSYGYTAMAKTVGFPTAIASRMILNGEIAQHGIVVPMNKDVGEKMLKLVRDECITSSVTKHFY